MPQDHLFRFWQRLYTMATMQGVTRSPTAVMRQLRVVALVIIVGVTIVLSFAVLGRTQSYLVRQNETYARDLALHLNQILYPAFITPLTQSNRGALPNTLALDQAVERTMSGLNVRQLTIYDRNRRILYAMQPAIDPQRGQRTTLPELFDALRGNANSTFLPEAEPTSSTTSAILATFVPVHPVTGTALQPEVIGAFVIEQDLSAILTQLYWEQAGTIGLVVSGMVLLLLALLLAIRWATQIIHAQQAALAAQNAALIQLQQTRDDLTQLLVHDLRTPLTAITGYLQLLALSELSDDHKALINTVRTSSRTMQRLVSTILDMQRLQEVRLPLDYGAIDVAALLQALGEEFAGWAQLDAKRVLTTTANDLPPLYADADLVQRVLANLVGNALKHTPQGTTVTLSAALSDQRQLLLVVRDDGQGIPVDVLPRLFTRYARGTGAKQGGSSGLGLAFCRLAVEAHGGTIAVASSLQEGTTFTIHLPLAAPQPDGATLLAPPDPGTTPIIMPTTYQRSI